MPEIDPAQVLSDAQEEAKNANENLRLYLLAQNERLQNENASLQNIKEELNVENGRLGIMVNLYETANWFYLLGTILFAISGVCSNHVWDGVFWLIFCIGALCFGIGLIPKIGIFRSRRSNNS